jgi:GR25 family glycosyltransferase involved in LPS biosynthesis
MISIDIKDGLGNQLFQLMTLIAYSKKYNNPFIIEKKSHSPGCTYRNVYWNNFLNKLEKYLVNTPIHFQIFEEKSFVYNELPEISNNTNLKLSGSFKSYKYFDFCKKDLLNDIDFETKKKEVKNKVTDVNPLEMISMHIRIGDIINVHSINSNILSLDYYINAINYIINQEKKDNIKILYFCEDVDIDFVKNNYIYHLKNIFPNIIFTQSIIKLEDWEQMILMSLCKHHIVANSTFSWWSAYFADNNMYKIICYPDKWSHSSIINEDTIDLFPNNWIMCDTKINKYLLENVYYINLKESKDRRIETEEELRKMNWKFQRFDGIKVKDGRLGVCLSHLKVIEMAKQNNLEYVVVVEDDIQFLEPEKYNNMLMNFKDFMNSNNVEYDVLLFAANIPDKINGVKPITNHIYKVYACLTATGYIVKRHYYDKLIENYKESIQLLINYSNIDAGCIDVNWIKLQGPGNWFILMPRTINQRPSHSIIQNTFVNYTSLLID